MTRLFIIAAFALGACSSGDNSDNLEPAADAGVSADAEPQPDAAPPVPSVEVFCAPEGPFDQIFGALRECGGFIRTLEINGTDLFSGAGLESFCLDLYRPMTEDGTLSIDADAMAACSTYATTTSCDEIAGDSFNFNGTPCEDVFVGAVPLGGECDLSEQCVGESFCEQGKGDCGACSPRLEDAIGCTIDDQCINGLCNSQGLCAAPAVVGGACVTAEDCVGLLDCDAGTCASLLPSLGDACVVPADCSGPAGVEFPFDIGLYCGPSGTCEAAPVVGDACLPEEVLGLDFAIDQGACNVFEYEWCDAGTCAAPQTSAAGEPCNLYAVSGSGARRCESDLLCSNPQSGFEGPDGVCQVPGYVGDTCDLGIDGAPPLEPCSPIFPCVNGTCIGSSDYTGLCPAP